MSVHSRANGALDLLTVALADMTVKLPSGDRTIKDMAANHLSAIRQLVMLHETGAGLLDDEPVMTLRVVPEADK